MDSEFSSKIAKFSIQFLKELDEKKVNAISSPLSAEYVLALLALGSTGQTHEEILNSLGIANDDEIRSTFAAVSSKLNSVQGVTLDVANKIYLPEDGGDLNPTLEKDAVEFFDAGIEKVDFSKPDAAAKLINGWVESKTNDKIKDLLPPDCLGPETRLVLVNALYFKGTWEKQFDPEETSVQDFYLGNQYTLKVPMMFQRDRFNHFHSYQLNAQILEMPYEGGEASMVVVLPNQMHGLHDLIQKLADGHDLLADLNSMRNTLVQVHFPKFKIETEIDLKVLLPKLGIKQLFGGQYGLTKLLNGGGELVVSKAIQKAFIEVNEEGAEAAAATALVSSVTCVAPPTPLFLADHPFVYIILDSARTPLFIGVYRGKGE